MLTSRSLAPFALWAFGGSIVAFAAFTPTVGHHKPKPKAQANVPPREPIEFNRDIRPILSNKCLSCHGHDPKAVQAGLKLDTHAGAIAKLADGIRAIVPHHPEKSELLARINEKDPAMRMPPPDSNKVLSQDEKDLLKQWIEEGAVYKPHWAFVAPVRPALPKVHDSQWVKSPIDTFILAKLEHYGLKPSPAADKSTLLRRVTLDITGLPPTEAEVAAFKADKSPKAYEKVVDRLLASPRYGERMAMDWMDYARYADSNGYQADYERYQWRWRDWVIKAFNANMPYDQFTIKQLAGDLLPHPTLQDRIATGFNRNHRINTEGGVIAEEWRVETVIDRVETTSATWLGLTTGCARCHDHKYDPISQKDFYSLCAYFNNVPETGTGVEQPVNHPPFIKAPTQDQQTRYIALQTQLNAEDAQLKARLAANEGPAQDWNPAPRPTDATLASATVARYQFGPSPVVVLGTSAAPVPSSPVTYSEGRSTGAVTLDGKEFLDLGSVGQFAADKPFSYSLWINPKAGNGSPISRMDAGHDYRGWDLFLSGGQPAVHLVNKWPENALKVIGKPMLPNGQWSQVTMTYDGSMKAAGVHFYINGKPVETTVEADALNGPIATNVSTKIGTRTGADAYMGQVDDPALFNRALTPAEVSALADANPALPLLKLDKLKRTEAQKAVITEAWSLKNDPDYAKLADEQKATKAAQVALDQSITTVMVMEDMPKPRQAYVLIRGQYDHLGEKVSMRLPTALPPMPAGAPNNRLGLAMWIVSPTNPLTARVTMNRVWERFFGTGIVATSEDFGTRAEYPSHPELLDWLATEFLRKHWDLKAMVKEVAMSATYQQSSGISRELEQRDPNNRLLARGPRFRLPAEMIRDQALYAAGMLTEKLGGPSVRPYQPEGIWDEVSNYGNLHNYKHDVGPNLHRRSLYTIWKRTAAPPEMTVFDATARETCIVKRARTDTPLQALALLNDETYIEASRALAQRAIEEAPSAPSKRIAYMFEALTGRQPAPAETKVLMAGFDHRLQHYLAHPAAADQLVKIGDWPVMPKVNHAGLAAYTVVASEILNLDETITKE